MLRNSGSVIVRDVRTVMELENLDSKMLSNVLVKDCNRCLSRCNAWIYLRKVNPTIKGKPLP